CNPVPYDVLRGMADIVVAIDVVGFPCLNSGKAPSTVELLFGTTQLMMQSIIEMQLQISQPDILLRPPVGRFRVLDFLKLETILRETASLKEEFKQKLDVAFSLEMAGRWDRG